MKTLACRSIDSVRKNALNMDGVVQVVYGANKYPRQTSASKHRKQKLNVPLFINSALLKMGSGGWTNQSSSRDLAYTRAQPKRCACGAATESA